MSYSKQDLDEIAEKRQEKEAARTQPVMKSIQQTKQELVGQTKQQIEETKQQLLSRIHEVNEQMQQTKQDLLSRSEQIKVELEGRMGQLEDLLKKIESLIEQKHK